MRKSPQKQPKRAIGVLALGSEEKCSAGRRQKILFFSQSGPSISVIRVPEEKLAVHNFLG